MSFNENKSKTTLVSPALEVGGANIDKKDQFAISIAAGLFWLAFAAFLSRYWLADLAGVITLPGAIIAILGLALIPGYLAIFLLTSVILNKNAQWEIRDFSDITVLIAAFNEEGHVRRTIRSVLDSNYGGGISIIVINDGSTDRTAEEIWGLEKKTSGQVKLLDLPHAGKASALNAGLQAANSDLVLTLDADTVLHPEAISRIYGRLQHEGPQTVAVAGNVICGNHESNFLTRLQHWDYHLGISSIKRSQSVFSSTLVAQGAFSLYRKKELEKIGGWRDMAGEDIVLTWELLERGHQTAFEPTAVAETRVPEKLKHFQKQRSRWARGMIEGILSSGGGILKKKEFPSHGVFLNMLFPTIDFCYTFVFLPGVILAATGNFLIVGPVTLLLLPLGGFIFTVLYRVQKRSLAEVGINLQFHLWSFLIYLVFYQLLLAPISLWGYLPGSSFFKKKVVKTFVLFLK